MATDATTADRAAFDRFKELDPGAPRRWYSDPESGYCAYVTVVGGAGAWMVWRGDDFISGRRSHRMDAHSACREALAAIEAIKAGGEVTHGT